MRLSDRLTVRYQFHDTQPPEAQVLLAAGDVAFELRVAGYEFPDATTDSVNWLLVEGAVRHPRGGWRFRDPSLLTNEVARLANWLEMVAVGSEPEPGCWFIEPNLSFEVNGEGSDRLLRVSFAAEARPPWADAGAEVRVEFPAAELDFEAAVTSLRRQLRAWPERPESAGEGTEPDATTDSAG